MHVHVATMPCVSEPCTARQFGLVVGRDSSAINVDPSWNCVYLFFSNLFIGGGGGGC